MSYLGAVRSVVYELNNSWKAIKSFGETAIINDALGDISSSSAQKSHQTLRCIVTRYEDRTAVPFLRT